MILLNLLYTNKFTLCDSRAFIVIKTFNYSFKVGKHFNSIKKKNR